MNSFGNKIKELRNEKGTTQKAMAEYLNISTSTLSHWECDYQEPAFKDLIMLSQFFNVSVDELLENEITPEEKAAGASATKKISITPIEDDMLYVFRQIGKTYGTQAQRDYITVGENMLKLK